MTRKEIEDLIEELIYAHDNMRDYQLRVDTISWSREKEQEAVNHFYNLRDKIVNLIGWPSED